MEIEGAEVGLGCGGGRQLECGECGKVEVVRSQVETARACGKARGLQEHILGGRAGDDADEGIGGGGREAGECLGAQGGTEGEALGRGDDEGGCAGVSYNDFAGELVYGRKEVYILVAVNWDVEKCPRGADICITQGHPLWGFLLYGLLGFWGIIIYLHYRKL